MKHRIFPLLCLSALVSLQTFAQPALQWDKRFNGSIGNDQGNAIAVDASGNVYVAASSDGTNFMSDYLIIKYTSSGDTVWSKRYNGSANGIDMAVAIKVDASGNVYATGHSQSTGTGYDIVTLKYNSQGVQQWAKVFDGGNSGANKDDMGYDLEVDIAGNVYVVGSSCPVGGTNTDGVVIKYNSVGTLLWKININEMSNPEITNLVTINNLGNVVVVEGAQINDSYKIIELNPSNGSTIKRYNIFTAPEFLAPVLGFPEDMVLDGNNNMYVVSSANQFGLLEVHTAKFSHGGSGTRAWDFYNQATGSAMISGVGIDIDAALNTYVLSDFYNGSSHYFHLKKHNPSGAIQWSKSFSATPGVDNVPVSLSLSKEVVNPSIFVSGYTATGNINTVKFNNNGDTLWQKIYDCGNNGADVASKMIADDCDNIYITGYSNCNGTNKDVKTIKYSTSLPIVTVIGSSTICQNESVTLTTDACTGCSYLWSSGQTTHTIIVSPIATTNYTVTVTNADNCATVSSPVTITVNPLPDITITGNPSICTGNSTSLNASGANSYIWSPSTGLNNPNSPNPVASPVTTTTYTVAGTANGCSNTASITIVVNPIPTITAIASPPTICVGSTAMLSAIGGATYSWAPATGLNDPNIPNPTASPVITTIYTVTGTANGCSNTATVTIIVANTPAQPGNIVGETQVCSGITHTYSVSPVAGAISYNWTLPPGWIGLSDINTITVTTGNSGGNIVVTALNDCGSSAVQFLSVTIKSTPAQPGDIAGESQVCSETTQIYSVDPVAGATSYTWTLPSDWTGNSGTNIIATTTGATSGNIAVAAVNDCGSSIIQTLGVSVNPTPPQPSISQNGDTLISSAPAGNQWYFEGDKIDTAINQTYIAIQSGDYTVTTTINGCTSVPSLPFYIEVDIMSAGETDISNLFDVYPNPACDFFYVKIVSPDFDEYNASLEIFDNLGRCIKTIKPSEFLPFVKIDCENLSDGIYFVVIKQGNQIKGSKSVAIVAQQ